MLTLHDMQYVAGSVSYKDWEISVEPSMFEGPYLRINAVVPNAYDGAPIMLDVHSPIPFPLIRTDDDFITWLMWRIWIMESHEAREFFTVGDTRPFDPHAEGANIPTKKEIA